MLVVIALIVALAAIALAFLPKTESRLANQGADQLQTYIAAARARAARDNVPSGIRLVGTGPFTEFQFIQTPEPFAPTGAVVIAYSGPDAQTPSAAGYIAIQGDQTSGNPVIRGDLLEITQGGSVHRVIATPYAANIGPNNSTFTVYPLASVPSVASVASPVYFPPQPNLPTLTTPPAGTNAGFRFIREPRPLMGETPLQLPQYVQVENNSGGSLNIPTGFSGQSDIIFSPSGQVVNASQGRIVLWVDTPKIPSATTLLCIYTRTGGVAAHPVAPGANAYAFTQDGMNSGQ